MGLSQGSGKSLVISKGQTDEHHIIKPVTEGPTELVFLQTAFSLSWLALQ